VDATGADLVADALPGDVELGLLDQRLEG